jgi:hypothetical protein
MTFKEFSEHLKSEFVRQLEVEREIRKEEMERFLKEKEEYV